MNLGENIYKLRTEKNMSQGDMADALEVSRQSVSKWENNSAVPELEKLIKMAQLFEVSIDELINGRSVASKPAAASLITVRMIIGSILIGVGALGTVLLLIFEPGGVFLISVFFLVGLILLTNLSPRGIWMMVVVYLAFFLVSCREPSVGFILTLLGLGLGYGAAHLWDTKVEHDEEGEVPDESR